MITNEEIEKLKQELEYYKSVDIKDVQLDELKDINDVQIDTSKPVAERLLSFLSQMGNPYIFKVGDIIVKVNYNSDGPRLQEVLEKLLKKELGNNNIDGGCL